MTAQTHTAWTRLSPWLDELLDLEEAERNTRLAALALQDGPLAEQLRQLLSQLQNLDQQGFMQAPAHANGVAPDGEGSHVGQVVGAYTLERLLGEGGMGAVWLARRSDGRFQGQVAIKFLHGSRRNPALARRFAREAQLLARLEHPHIARLLDAGLSEGDAQPYLVLEYVEGQPIDQWCDSQDLDLPARLQLLLDVMDAVSHAHERLVLHRDLKPSNILVNTQGQVKLLDFGIARVLGDTQDGEPDLTRIGGLAYTPRWASPEQVNGGELTPASDVFALGLLMHHLLTGLHPLGAEQTGRNIQQLRALLDMPTPLASAHLQSRGEATDMARVRALRGDLDTVIAKALKKAPAERYRSAADLADDLRRHLRHEPILARPDGAAYRTSRFLRRHWLAVGAAGAVSAALVVGGGVALMQARQAQAERAQAEGLLEYMLGDLRSKLEPLGQLPLLDGVGSRALAYYDAKALSSLDDAALARRTKALHLLGSIAEQQGRMEAAGRIAQQAFEGSQLLLQRQPQDVQALSLHAASEGRRALAAEGANQMAQAETGYLARLRLYEQALALKPDDVRLRRAVSDSQGELAGLYAHSNRPDLALPLFELERDELARQAPADASLWHLLANNRAWVANTLYGQDRFEDALVALRAHLQAIERVPDLKANTEARWYGALGQNRLSGILQALGRLDEAEDASRLAVKDMQALAAQDPSNTSWQMQAGYHKQQLANVLWERGQAEEARREITESRAIVDAINPSADTRLERLAAVRLRVMSAQAELTPQAPGLFQQLRQRVDEETRREPRIDKRGVELGVELARARLGLGGLWAARGKPEEARAVWQTALDELDRQYSGDKRLPAGGRYTRARLLLALGQVEATATEAETLQQLGWRAGLDRLKPTSRLTPGPR